MKASEAAYKAADLISEHGHAKGVLKDDQGRFCFSGALCAATGATLRPGVHAFPFISSAQRAVYIEVWDAAGAILSRRAASAQVPGTWSRVIPAGWNNRDDTTKEDVVLLLKETGRELEEKGL
jgi:hypothetical protein